MNNSVQLHMLCECLLASGHIKVQSLIRQYMSYKFKNGFNCKAIRKMHDLQSRQEHCQVKLLLTIITGYYCITVMDLCDMIIILLHITSYRFLHTITTRTISSTYFIENILLYSRVTLVRQVPQVMTVHLVNPAHKVQMDLPAPLERTA